MGKALRTALSVYSVVLTILKIAVAAVILLAIYSFAVQNVALENVGKPFTQLEGSKLIIRVPVTIKNYGFYSIDNISVSYVITNRTATLLRGKEFLGNIEKGTIETISVPVVIDMERLYHLEYPSLYHFFNRDVLNATITISLFYMMHWVKVKVTTVQLFDWVPLLEKVEVSRPVNISMDSSGNMKFYVPYLLKTASYLSGIATIGGKILSDGEVCGNFSGSAELGESYRGEIEMNVHANQSRELLTKSQYLEMVGNISLFGVHIPFTHRYYWGAPLANLTYRVLPNGTVFYSFTDESPMALSLKVTKIFYYQGAEVSRDVTNLHVVSGEHVERYEKITLTQPVDEVKIIFYEENTHLLYEEVLHI